MISAHCLEHCPDTLSVLKEWRRVLKPGGSVMLVLPHADRTFDKGRRLTTYEHHLAEEGRAERFDDAHWSEFEAVALLSSEHPGTHDPAMKREDGTWNREAIADANYMHYHVWTQHEISEIILEMGMTLRFLVEQMPNRYDSFMLVATR